VICPFVHSSIFPSILLPIRSISQSCAVSYHIIIIRCAAIPFSRNHLAMPSITLYPSIQSHSTVFPVRRRVSHDPCFFPIRIFPLETLIVIFIFIFVFCVFVFEFDAGLALACQSAHSFCTENMGFCISEFSLFLWCGFLHDFPVVMAMGPTILILM